MKAAELYQKMLDQYKDQLQQGRNVSLTAFCREQHVNYKAMFKWLGKHGICVKSLREMQLSTEDLDNTQEKNKPLFVPVTPPVSQTEGLNPELDVTIETPEGYNVHIQKCHPQILASLLFELKSKDRLCLR